jgi:transposase InsO family protein
MRSEDKKEILDFVRLYAVLGIVRLETLCHYIGISARTIQRWNTYGTVDKRKGAKKNVPRAYSKAERDHIYTTACSAEYKDMNPHEVYNSLLDKGKYLASESTFYRILREHKPLEHRSECRGGTSKKKPDELTATEKNKVWMWDITWLKTDVKGIYHYAYVIEDLFDRSIVSWAIYENESDEHAKELLKNACEKEQAHPDFVHSDNGEPMKGITLVAFYYRLGIVPSYSRPRVSDDNPYIESFFKTLKYTCGYPKFFTSLEQARTWLADFIDWYNNDHMHSSLQYITPMQKRSGEYISIFNNRNMVICNARAAHPERWGSRPARKYEIRTVEVLNPAKKDVA